MESRLWTAASGCRQNPMLPARHCGIPISMTTPGVKITSFENAKHREQVVALWKSVFGYQTPHNSPELSIDKKMAVADGMFFVATHGQLVVGTIMTGYDGHRGWINYLSVVDRSHGPLSRLLDAVTVIESDGVLFFQRSEKPPEINQESV